MAGDADRFLMEVMNEHLARKEELLKFLQNVGDIFLRKTRQMQNALCKSDNVEEELREVLEPIIAEKLEDLQEIEALSHNGVTPSRLEIYTNRCRALKEEAVYLNEVLVSSIMLNKEGLLKRVLKIAGSISHLLEIKDQDQTNVVAILDEAERITYEVMCAIEKLQNDLLQDLKSYRDLLKFFRENTS